MTETGLIFSNEEAQQLGIQIEIIKELVGYVCETVTDEHSAELVHLTRESMRVRMTPTLALTKLIFLTTIPFC